MITKLTPATTAGLTIGKPILVAFDICLIQEIFQPQIHYKNGSQMQVSKVSRRMGIDLLS